MNASLSRGTIASCLWLSLIAAACWASSTARRLCCERSAVRRSSRVVGPIVLAAVATTPMRLPVRQATSAIRSSILTMGTRTRLRAMSATSPTDEHWLNMRSAPASCARVAYSKYRRTIRGVTPAVSTSGSMLSSMMLRTVTSGAISLKSRMRSPPASWFVCMMKTVFPIPDRTSSPFGAAEPLCVQPTWQRGRVAPGGLSF